LIAVALFCLHLTTPLVLEKMDFKHKLSSEPGHDVVFLSVLALKATVGPETWHRLNRPQPVILDIRMRTNIALAGDTDDVLKTIHYGNLCKAVTKCVESSGPFSDLKHFAGAVCEAALGPGGGGNEVDLTVTLPKALLLAEGVGLSTVQISGGDKAAVRIQSQSLFVRDMKLACIIGVNPHERLEKQHIVINLIFYEITSDLFTDYAKVVKNITDVRRHTLALAPRNAN
jgi:FolB domain-containing protein